MTGGRRASWLAVVGLAGLMAAQSSPAPSAAPPADRAGGAATDAPAPPTDEQWKLAVAAARKVALDPAEPDEYRANAVIAYAKMQAHRGQVAEALKVCRQVFDNPTNPPVATAAIKAGCFLRRHADGQMGGPGALIAQWERTAKGGASRQALNTARTDLNRMRAALMSLAGRRPVPPARFPDMPAWGRRRGQDPPHALNFSRPKVDPPGYILPRKDAGPAALAVSPPEIKPPSWLTTEDARRDPLNVKLPVYESPRWYPARDGRTGIPAALNLSLPTYSPPSWVARVSFPLLKPAKK